MDELEKQQRRQIIDEAISWLRTPYHSEGRVKGGGVDCGMFILEVFERCGLIEHVEVPHYPCDWHLHRSEQKYLGWVQQYCQEVTKREPLPGDIILYQYGRCISHGAIVVNYPKIIHSYIGLGVIYADNEQGELLKRQRAIYSYWPES